MSIKDEPASPCIEENDGGHYYGLTKREYFAGIAMQGLLSNNSGWTIEPNSVALYARDYSDALLRALEDKG